MPLYHYTLLFTTSTKSHVCATYRVINRAIFIAQYATQTAI